MYHNLSHNISLSHKQHLVFFYQPFFQYDIQPYLAKPIETEGSDSDVIDLPTILHYDLPAPRQKTVLEEYTHTESMNVAKTKPETEEEPTNWERLPVRQSGEVENHSIILGKGSPKGKEHLLLHLPIMKNCY